MKTIKERARNLAHNGWHQSTETLQRCILEALRQEQKLTRHACADSLDELVEHDNIDGYKGFIKKSQAQKAILNTKAV